MQTAPTIDLSTIPAAQRAAVLALMETVAALTEITRRQEHLIAELNHALHGKRSEKLSEDERQLAFEDLMMIASGSSALLSTSGQPVNAVWGTNCAVE
jgi:transposase